MCLQGKQTRLPFTDTTEDRKAKRILETVSTDVCGPISPGTHDEKNYFLTFIDHYSHFCVCYLLKHKSEVMERLQEYVSMVEAKFNVKIEKLRCDNGGEYVSKMYTDFCTKRGIRIQYTVPHTPEQNGVAERFNRTIMERARCLIFDSELNKEMWGEAVRTSIYLINRTETRVLSDKKTPAEIWHNQKPNLEKIKLFGCTSFNLIPKEVRKSKLESHCQKLIMIGYADNGYRLWDENKRKVVHARNVVFEELGEKEDPNIYIDSEPSNTNSSVMPIKANKTPNKCNKNEEKSEINEAKETQRKSSRNRHLPSYLSDYELSEEDESVNLFAALSVGNFLEIPVTYGDAISRDKNWKHAIQEEITSLEENETWDLVVPPVNVEIIDSKWIFREKEVDGIIKKKARLVARGYQQCSLTEDVYAPVARMSTVRVLLSLFVECDMFVQQLDVKSAFLNGMLKEPVYMVQPEGLESTNPHLVCKLNKALYGLKQSPKCWNSLFNDTLEKLGFQRSKKDPCLYFTDTIFLLIHVDDLIIFSKSVKELDVVKTNLSKIFKMQEFKNEKITFLGLEITKTNDCLYITQKDLIKKVLKKFNMNDCKTSNVPMQPKLQLSNGETGSNKNLPYRELIGCLMYIMLGSRPDLSFSISYFSQFQGCFNIEHWNYLKCVLRYLKLTENYGLKFIKSDNSNVQIHAYVDADFANDSIDRKSISGFVLKMNDNVIYWKTKKQNIVALSSAESEYIALSSCISESLFLGQMLSEVLKYDLFPIFVYEDNQSCIKMASTFETKRTKHIDVRHHFVRDCVNKNEIVLKFTPTEFQQADIFTKALSSSKFVCFRNNLNVVEINTK